MVRDKQRELGTLKRTALQEPESYIRNPASTVASSTASLGAGALHSAGGGLHRLASTTSAVMASNLQERQALLWNS